MQEDIKINWFSVYVWQDGLREKCVDMVALPRVGETIKLDKEEFVVQEVIHDLGWLSVGADDIYRSQPAIRIVKK